MRATSETGYYFLELVKFLIPLLPIAIILLATVLLHRIESTRRSLWLGVITAIWLIVALGSRFTLSSAMRNRVLSGTNSSVEAARAQIDFYFTLSSWFFILEQVMFTIFAVALLLLFRASAWRAKPREDI